MKKVYVRKHSSEIPIFLGNPIYEHSTNNICYAISKSGEGQTR